MKALKWVAIGLLAYVGLVVLFESMLGFFQPQGSDTLVITTYDPDGTAHRRVVSALESGGRLYVAANHWPRAWYRRALSNPQVEITYGGATSDRTAVPVSGEEHTRVDAEHSLPFAFRVLTGFPSRYLVRLDPR